MDQKDLDSPLRELSNGGLESVVTLLVRWQTNIPVCLQEKQSSCIVPLVTESNAQNTTSSPQTVTCTI